jgi:hypothetical protein
VLKGHEWYLKEGLGDKDEFGGMIYDCYSRFLYICALYIYYISSSFSVGDTTMYVARYTLDLKICSI